MQGRRHIAVSEGKAFPWCNGKQDPGRVRGGQLARRAAVLGCGSRMRCDRGGIERDISQKRAPRRNILLRGCFYHTLSAIRPKREGQNVLELLGKHCVHQTRACRDRQILSGDLHLQERSIPNRPPVSITSRDNIKETHLSTISSSLNPCPPKLTTSFCASASRTAISTGPSSSTALAPLSANALVA